MNSISPNLNIMIKASEKASKVLIRDFGEIEKLQVSKKGPRDFVSNADLKTEKIILLGGGLRQGESLSPQKIKPKNNRPSWMARLLMNYSVMPSSTMKLAN